MELAGSTGTRITGTRITSNGRGGSAYNGDGIQLGRAGALVSGNTSPATATPGLYEHGVYTAAAMSRWTIAGISSERHYRPVTRVDDRR